MQVTDPDGEPERILFINDITNAEKGSVQVDHERSVLALAPVRVVRIRFVQA